MEELIDYVKKTFDEQTLKVVNFIERANLLISEMKIDQIMRNFVSHKDSHMDIRFEKNNGTYNKYVNIM